MTAFVTGSSLALDFGFAYLVGRAFIRSANDLRLLFLYALPGLAIVALVLAFESISHNIFLRPFLADVLGKPEPVIYSRIRWGLVRAVGPFPHPILGGVFLATMLPLAIFLTNNWRQCAIAVLVTLSSLFVVSSTALLALILAAALTGAYAVQRLTRVPVFLVIAFYLSLLYVAIGALSESGPLSFFIRYFTLDEGSGYYRTLIWQFAGAEAAANPFFGIGLRDWARPGWMGDSVDSYWLVLSMRYGIPSALASAVVMAGTIGLLASTGKHRSSRDQHVAVALAILLFTVMFSGLSVHIWEGLHIWVIMLCGASVTFAKEYRSAVAGDRA
ncbi:hypothetical protein [Aurantiacibacter sp. D1-12]|uniref:hypothetical protein n=1 Tax=Aurantiacibacter sp. D1-12 TaxID=2993658 RepID=UPI00237C8C47|nr:hypothetical protein [Aurantiacibacter sp. D1-12]